MKTVSVLLSLGVFVLVCIWLAPIVAVALDGIARAGKLLGG